MQLALWNCSLYNVDGTVEWIVSQTMDLIDQKELLKQMPTFINLMTTGAVMMNLDVGYLEEPERPKLDQQQESCVVKIPVDSLAVKEVRKEKAQHSRTDSPRSSISKLKVSRVSRNTVRLQQTSSNKKKSSVSEVIPIETVVETEEDEQVKLQRKRLMFEQKQREKQRQIELEKQKKLQEARESLQNNNGYTFDTDGSVLPSSFVDTDKMNVHVIRMFLAKSQKLKQRDAAGVARQSLNISPPRDENKYNTIDLGSQKPAPKFVEKPRLDGNSKFAHMKKQQFSMVFGSRYSPWHQRPISKGLTTHDTSMESLQLVTSQRQAAITDRAMLNPTKRSIITPDKLTLPKLRGRYSLLDRYTSLDLRDD